MGSWVFLEMISGKVHFIGDLLVATREHYIVVVCPVLRGFSCH